MIQGYIDFLGTENTLVVLLAAVAVVVAAAQWLYKRDFQPALMVGVFGAAIVWGALILASVCRGLQGAWVISVPDWWQNAVVVLAGAAGLTCLVLVIKAADAQAGVFAGFFGAVAAYYLLGWLSPVLIFPLCKYAIGYGIPVLAPFCFAVPLVYVGLQLLDPGRRLRWLLPDLVFFVGVVVYLLTKPVMAEPTGSYFGDVLAALAPSVLATLVLGTRRGLAPLFFCVLGLYVWVAALLFRVASPALLNGMFFAPDAHANALAASLLSPLSAWALYVAFWGVVAWYFLLAAPRSPGGIAAAPVWIVVMPWLCLVPAFYFANLGVKWFLLFMLLNAVVGLALVGEVVYSFVGVRAISVLRLEKPAGRQLKNSAKA